MDHIRYAPQFVDNDEKANRQSQLPLDYILMFTMYWDRRSTRQSTVIPQAEAVLCVSYITHIISPHLPEKEEISSRVTKCHN